MSPDEPESAPHTGYVWHALAALSLGLVLVLGYQVARRVVFPWDTYIWSESPFMTNMMKLSSGAALYQSADALNSFVYAPGLELVCYGLLRPFGLALDVRACRVVVVLLGLGASACGALTIARFFSAIEPGRRLPKSLLMLAFCAVCLVLFKNFTADVCHPDNLHVFHATASLALGGWALITKKRAHVLVAVFVAALAVFAKQNAACGGIGLALALLWAEPSFRTRANAIPLLAVSVLTSCLALWLTFRTPSARFWLIDVPTSHVFQMTKVQTLWSDVYQTPHRALAFCLAPFAAFFLYAKGNARLRQLVVLWALVGAAEVLPALVGYFKFMGLWNNLGILDVWALLVLLPVLISVPVAATPRALALRLGACTLLLLALVPARLPPGPEQYEYGNAIDQAVRDAKSAGKKLLLSHGTMALIHAGIREPPLDRMNSMLELAEGEKPIPSAALDRIENARYDVIFYYDLTWYGALGGVINGHYREDRIIAPPTEQPSRRGYPRYELEFGYQQDLNAAKIRVMLPKARR